MLSLKLTLGQDSVALYTQDGRAIGVHVRRADGGNKVRIDIAAPDDVRISRRPRMKASDAAASPPTVLPGGASVHA